MTNQNQSGEPNYKKWCRVLDHKTTKKFKNESKFDFYDLAFEKSQSLLTQYLTHHYPHEIIPKLKRLEISIYTNDNYEEAFIIDSYKNLYIRSFYYHTLTQNALIELATLVVFFNCHRRNLVVDFILDLVKNTKSFLHSRKKHLKEDEYEAVYSHISEEDKQFIWGLQFVNVLHYGNEFACKLSHLEVRNLKEIYFSKKMKKILNLDTEDYEYIQKSQPWKTLNTKDQEKFSVIKSEIENNQISIEEYVENQLAKKKILFWCMWTISPFLTMDISRLFTTLHEYKNITRVYLDIPQSSQGAIDEFTTSQHQNENIVENEIRRLYPSIVNEYAKETLPYLKILEKIQLYKISQTCIGESGDELNKRLPILKDNQLFLKMDEIWESSTIKETKLLPGQSDNDLVIFFYFLKPMNYLAPFMLEHPEIESLIHVDSFTGYGPNKSENQLSYYSHFHPQKQQLTSFVLSNLQQFSMRDERIVFFPYKDDEYPRFNDEYFNRFHLYDSLLFSGNRGGGGSKRNSFLTPHNPDRRKIRV